MRYSISSLNSLSKTKITILPLLQTSSYFCIFLFDYWHSYPPSYPSLKSLSHLNSSHFHTRASRCLINSVGSTFEISFKSRLFSTLPPIILLLEFGSFISLALTAIAGACQINSLRKSFPHLIRLHSAIGITLLKCAF